MENKMILRVGTEVKASADIELKGLLGEESEWVKKGHKGFVDSQGFLHWDCGKIQKMADVEVKGVNHDDIAKLIFDRLNRNWNLGDMLEVEDIDETDFRNEISYILSDIL